jgi:hypothetical protein
LGCKSPFSRTSATVSISDRRLSSTPDNSLRPQPRTQGLCSPRGKSLGTRLSSPPADVACVQSQTSKGSRRKTKFCSQPTLFNGSFMKLCHHLCKNTRVRKISPLKIRVSCQYCLKSIHRHRIFSPMQYQKRFDWSV